MTEGELFLIDTNIVVYYHDAADSVKHAIAKRLIDRCFSRDEIFAVSSQNLSEFFSVTTTKKLLTKKEALNFISDIVDFSGWVKIDFSHKTVVEAARISDEYNMPYWDSLLAATMKQNGVLNLYTENVKDIKVPWIHAVDPFGKR
ncbi:MAG: PIN domain-containing protein [Candidatus Aenigmarchaeota archaeon]|nr:PIN domain-containing protein [Candidatus Aenigmarchaeota archaeon]